MSQEDDDVTQMLKSLFQKYDSNCSGCLAQEELRELLQTDFGMDDDEISTFSLLLDKDGSGTLTFPEFSRVVHECDVINKANQCRAGVIQRAVDLFKKYDEDGSNALGKEEFHELYLGLGGQHDYYEKEMSKIDFDSNRRISFNEFLKWLNWVPMEIFE